MILPVVSVIVPFYKRIDYLKETLASVLAQTYSHWELILVNDEEFDNDQVRNHISTISDNGRIRLINRGQHPKGAPVCRNLGTQTSTGTYIIFLDSDDLLAPYCLEQRVNVMRQFSTLEFAVFPMLLFKDSPGDNEYLWNVNNHEEDLQRFLRLDTVWQTSGPIWKRQFLNRIGGFTDGLLCWQDVDLHLKALFHNPIYKKFYDFKPDCFYRKHNHESISQRRINTLEKLQSRKTIFQNTFRAIDEMNGDKEQYYRSSTIMLISILLSTIQSGNNSMFREIFFHHTCRRLLNWRKKIIILMSFLFHNLKLTRLSFLNILNWSHKHYVASRMEIGKHKVSNPVS